MLYIPHKNNFMHNFNGLRGVNTDGVPPSGEAGSPCGQVGWRGIVACRFYRRGFLSAGTQRAVSAAGDFSAVSHRGQVFGIFAYASKSSLPGDCHVVTLLAMTKCPIRGEAVGRAGRPRPAA